MTGIEGLAESVGAIRRRVSETAPYAMLRQAGIHGTITLSTEGTSSEFTVTCGACDEWSEVHSLDYGTAIAALEDHLAAVHGDYGTELVVIFR